MLSRIAESLFWIGRYLERAEDTCRIVEVHLQLLLDDPSVDQDAAGQSLLEVMGFPPPEGKTADAQYVLTALCYDSDSPASVAAALGGARESARRARETVSTEMWEAINTTWNSVRGGRLQRMRPATAFKHIRERCAVISGTADSTMSHDEGWQFLILGRSIERADMTARLIQSASITSGSQSAWNNVLRGCGAHHAFLRTYGGVTTDRDAAEFLLLDRLFPRSLVFTLTAAEDALADLGQTERRAGIEDAAQRLLGTARAELEYRPPGEVLLDLPSRMADLQWVCNQASAAISQRYFEGATAAVWRGGEQ
ncbi:MAG: alpha-E domain-containing protein [Micropruina sp.]|uniref:alpha-E domain-containing protein n=1 Tax=Micropruina sp. TaxID=2737536 RepID=UPI0039E34A60